MKLLVLPNVHHIAIQLATTMLKWFVDSNDTQVACGQLLNPGLPQGLNTLVPMVNGLLQVDIHTGHIRLIM